MNPPRVLERNGALPPFPKDRFISQQSNESRAFDAECDGCEVSITTLPKPLHGSTWERMDQLRALKHPSILPTVGVFDDGDVVRVVQTIEPVGSATVRPLLQELRARALALVSVLHVLHTKSLVHGHLTLDSLLITHDQLLLVQVPPIDPAAPAYPSTDIFAFGVLVYMLATGRHPYATSTTSSTIEILCNMDLVRFQVNKDALRHLSPPAQSLILDCLARHGPSPPPTTADLLKRKWFTAAMRPTSSGKPRPPRPPPTTTPPDEIETTTRVSAAAFRRHPLSSSNQPPRKQFSGSSATEMPLDSTGTTPENQDDVHYAHFAHYTTPPHSSFHATHPPTPPNAAFAKDMAAALHLAPSPATVALLPSSSSSFSHEHKKSVFRHVRSMPELPSMSHRPVVFSAYGPAAMLDHKCRVFIWAYLAQQAQEIRDLAAAAQTIETGRLSKGTRVRFGAMITVVVEPPPGWTVVGERAKSFQWLEDISRVFVDLAIDTDASAWSTLCRARILVGTHVSVLHFTLPDVATFPTKFPDDDDAPPHVEYKSSYEIVQPPASPMIPRSDFTLLEPVGSGFFGTAYRAQYHPTNKEVVVKTLKQGLGISRDEFEHEVQALTMLGRHPHVVEFLGACEDGDNLSVLMEYVPNGSLQSLLYPPKSPDHIQTNCLVDDQYHVKVCDFGLSRPVDRVMGHVLDSVSCGPLKWMAPESLELPHVFSPASDVYMYGVLLFEIMMGNEPFPSLPPHEAAALVLEGHRLTLSTLKECPATHQELMEQCFKVDPLERPSMVHVASTLDEWLMANA
ncbi:Aste57867_16773 [Aphanomyces stellatus]|uniref:Aste57867_16773 protein n=1 Tax=Aphanomyces stellatus TaxID=120398 RepID=A0A485L9B9_9STRA|nr:hypothetical protein As57867_016716 [Aphanomyces stellatus]VFT93538.1 Aste57867_16773 [Aphanomyces stellatus]